MRTIKPQCLSLLPRCIEHRRELYLCVSTMAMVPLREPAKLMSEQTLWQTLPQAFPTFIEAGAPKQGAEFLLAGAAYPPDGVAGMSASFGIRFAGIEKIGMAHGRRFAEGDLIVHREPLLRAPLDWASTYGGPGFPGNPLGIGHRSSARDDGYLPLPLIEAPGRPWHPDPARNGAFGFGLLDLTHPDRLACAGTYDSQWLSTEFPGLAADADLAIHNVAPVDQRFPKPLVGDESYELANLAAAHPLQRGRLPGILIRTFIQRGGATHEMEELKNALRTVVFMPEVDRVLLVWQGLCKVERDDASDVSMVMSAAERIGNLRPRGHYAKVLADRFTSEDAALLSLIDEPLLPEGMPFEAIISESVLQQEEDQDSFNSRLRRRCERQLEVGREEVQALGLDPAEHAPGPMGDSRPLPALPQLGEFMRQLAVEGERHIAKAKAAAQEMVNAAEAAYEAQGLPFDVIRDEMKGVGRGGPPSPEKPRTMASLVEARATGLTQKIQIAEIDDMLGDEKLHARWGQQDRDMRALYMRNAHHMNAASVAAGAFAERQQSEVGARLTAGHGLQGMDLTGADLRGFDLRGVDCTGAMLEAANLTGVCLEGVCFEGALLARANLEGARAAGCNFTDANLGAASLIGIDARGALFDRTNFYGTSLERACFAQAIFNEAQFCRASLAGIDLSEALLHQAQFVECDLSAADLRRALFDGAQFVDCRVAGAQWAGCRGSQVVFYKFACPGGDFSGAHLPGARFVEAVDLRGASFSGAVLTGAYFGQGSLLEGARFDEAQAAQCDFTACAMQNASLRHAVLRESSFRRALLDGSDFEGADLMDAALSNAQLFGARLVDCNLYAADLSRVRADALTRFDDSLTRRARVYPRWRPPAGSLI